MRIAPALWEKKLIVCLVEVSIPNEKNAIDKYQSKIDAYILRVQESKTTWYQKAITYYLIILSISGITLKLFPKEVNIIKQKISSELLECEFNLI